MVDFRARNDRSTGGHDGDPRLRRITTDYLLWLGSVHSASRATSLPGTASTSDARTYANKPQDSIPDFLFLYRGLAAGHLKAYNRAIATSRCCTRGRCRRSAAIRCSPSPSRRTTIATSSRAEPDVGKSADAIRLFEESLASDLGLYMAHVRIARKIYRAHQMWTRASRRRVAPSRRIRMTPPPSGNWASFWTSGARRRGRHHTQTGGQRESARPAHPVSPRRRSAQAGPARRGP